MDNFKTMCMLVKFQEFMEKNPERFTPAEKQKFQKDFSDWLIGVDSDSTIADEVFDFLVDNGFSSSKPRVDTFVSYLNHKYDFVRFKSVLDVGAGRMCKLSTALSKYGLKMHAIDPKIRLYKSELKQRGIQTISTQKFVCDDYARNGKGTDISGYDLILGLEPCDATEHIIRQCLKYDKPFDVLLCASPHDGLNGQKFKTYHDWFEHLNNISSEVNVSKWGNNYYASNTHEREM